MNKLNPSFVVASALVLAVAGSAAGAPKPPAKPAEIRISVEPTVVAPGQSAAVTLRLEPTRGVKIKRYPKIRLEVPAHEGLVPAAEVSVGNPAPPPPGQMERNYFDPVDPVRLELALDRGARVGKHEVEGKLTYFYCVTASGFCAPARVPVRIPLEVR